MPFTLSLDEGKILVELARNAVKEYLKTGKYIEPPKNAPEKLFEQFGVFVTINKLKNGKKELRGCIGYPYPSRALVEAVVESAIAAATQDARFYPISLNELGDVVFEVSVLTPPNKIEVKKPYDCVTKIKVGEDGLIVENGISKGLLLPQVPVEWDWNEEEFLGQCCIKAGLSPDSWLTEGTKIYKFQAIIFGETTPTGEIKQLHLNG